MHNIQVEFILNYVWYSMTPPPPKKKKKNGQVFSLIHPPFTFNIIWSLPNWYKRDESNNQTERWKRAADVTQDFQHHIPFIAVYILHVINIHGYEIHWASKETYHFFRATHITIQSIEINHNWAYISYDTPYQAHLKITFAWVKK